MTMRNENALCNTHVGIAFEKYVKMALESTILLMKKDKKWKCICIFLGFFFLLFLVFASFLSKKIHIIHIINSTCLITHMLFLYISCELHRYITYIKYYQYVPTIILLWIFIVISYVTGSYYCSTSYISLYITWSYRWYIVTWLFTSIWYEVRWDHSQTCQRIKVSPPSLLFL